MKNYVAFPRAARNRNNLVHVSKLLTYKCQYVYRPNCTFAQSFERAVLAVTRKPSDILFGKQCIKCAW